MPKPGPQLKGHPLKLVMTFQEKTVAEEYLNNCDVDNRRASENAEAERIAAYHALVRYILRLQKKLKKQREPIPRKGTPSLLQLTKRLMRSLSEDERLEIVSEYCQGCGGPRSCHRQNDE